MMARVIFEVTRVVFETTRSDFDTHKKETGAKNVSCLRSCWAPRESNSVRVELSFRSIGNDQNGPVTIVFA